MSHFHVYAVFLGTVLVAKKCCSELLFNVEKTQVCYPIHVQEFQIRSLSKDLFNWVVDRGHFLDSCVTSKFVADISIDGPDRTRPLILKQGL